MCVLQHYRPLEYVLTPFDVKNKCRGKRFMDKVIVIVTCFRVGANAARPEAPAATSRCRPDAQDGRPLAGEAGPQI